MISVKELNGLKIGLCQMPCIAARPDLNGAYFIHAIEEAERMELDLLVGPEGIQGYLIGDQYEYKQFLMAVDDMNEVIRKATEGKQIVVAYGSVWCDWLGRGEDGRVLRHNGGFIVQNGRVLQRANKTLSPNYRMFSEARYFFDNRKTAEEISGLSEKALDMDQALKKLLRPVQVNLRNGSKISIGQEFCEDMWSEDYFFKPTAFLALQGADIIINHSASPWTWRKNNKRHRVVKALMQGIPENIRPKLFVYVNRTGVEQSNKNFYVYDGSSAVYDSDGDLIKEVPPYYPGTKVFTFSADAKKIEGEVPDDTEALYRAMAAVIDNIYVSLPDEHRHVCIGISGGIDSAVAAALMVARLGSKRVRLVNMPYGDYNSDESKTDAFQVAKNLNTRYLVKDITRSVDTIAELTGVEKGTLAHKNIQARCRMEVLAALAQKQETTNGLEKKGGRFTANGNKIEMAFGYGTMYADIAGATMLFGDLVKREVYQLGDYLNRSVFCRTVIPDSVFNRPPEDGLSKLSSKDPFDYGSLEHRGYHDELVRAWTEWRKDPLWFLEEYAAGTLEKTLMLPEGHLRKLFPTNRDFVERLEKDWQMFTTAYWKRIQCPPVPVFTRRAFGGDLSESMNNFNIHTEAFETLKAKVLAAESKGTQYYDEMSKTFLV